MSSPVIVEDVTISDDEDSNCSNDDEASRNFRQSKLELIRNLFPPSTSEVKEEAIPSSIVISSDDDQDSSPKNTKKQSSADIPTNPTNEVFKRHIEGVEVIFPLKPYNSQMIVMSKVISALNKKQNCLVESPTGTGKTLALLCAALAWQKREEDRLSEMKTKDIFENHPELKEVDGAKEYIKTPVKYDIMSPEKLFSRNKFGEKSIYFEPIEEVPSCINVEKREFNRSESEATENIPTKKIKRNLNEIFGSNQPSTDKLLVDFAPMEQEDGDRSVNNNRLPVIYYSTRTHKQLEQVIKEFRRTVYCGKALMTILSSRDNSCLLSLDKARWSSKNDMCRECTKSLKSSNEPGVSNKSSTIQETNCEYYDNRKTLNHKSLPPAFDLNDLIESGNRLTACPYFAAKDMMRAANIVFCPYNYLVDPGIRNNLQINLKNNIVIIDEGHNIEDICRDTATFCFTKQELQSAIKEVNAVSAFLFANQSLMPRIEGIRNYLNNWEKWFDDKVKNMVIIGKEAVQEWDVEEFVQSLNSFEIGIANYNDFNKNVYEFCKKLRDDPRTLIGVTQTTGTFLESLDTVLGFLFRDWGKHMVDFKPVLEQKVRSNTHDINSWRTSIYNKTVQNESVTLRLICLNPAVIFQGLDIARTIILASGTLAPIKTLASELGTDFAVTASPRHIIPEDRAFKYYVTQFLMMEIPPWIIIYPFDETEVENVILQEELLELSTNEELKVWVKALSRGPEGTKLEMKREAQRRTDVQDELGRVLRHVCASAPHGVLCFLPSYELIETLVQRWKETKLWGKLIELKDVITESKNSKDHESNMKHYYESAQARGALLLAVYRGKVAEGMDFRDRQARAVVAVGIPFPNIGDKAVKGKMEYNDKYSRDKNILGGQEWLKIQAYRALNQAVGRCVRHAADWGAVLLVDSRLADRGSHHYLPDWVKRALERSHHSNLQELHTFFRRMSLEDNI